jgi:hypothetical protein
MAPASLFWRFTGPAGKMPALPSVFPHLAEFAETFREGANLPLV